MEWTIQHAGVEKTLADWGLTDMTRQRVNLAPDTVTLMANGRRVDAAEIFPYGTTAVIMRDRVRDHAGNWSGGTRWFWGRVEPWSRAGGPDAEAQMCVLVNPWWYLKEKVFRQVYEVFGGFGPEGEVITEQRATNRIFLNQRSFQSGGGKMTTGEQIIEALQWAIAAGAPIQIGEITPDLDVPIDEVKNIKCDEVLEKMYRWSPDAVFWWDYTTEPYPTIHCKRQAELMAVDVDLNAGNAIEEIRVRPRPDWKRPYVLLQFEQDNNGHLHVVEDLWPNPIPPGPEARFGGFETVVNLLGWQSSTTRAELRVAPIQIGELAWWVERFPWLGSPEVEVVEIDEASIVPQAEGVEYNPLLTYEVRDGGVAPWMRLVNGTPVIGQQVRAKASVRIRLKNGTLTSEEELSHEMVATNGVSGVYSSTQVGQAGDPVPVGLARQMWEAFQALACEGMITFVSREVSGSPGMGNVINLITPSEPAWASLGALVQSVTETAIDGRTAITFGAPSHLTTGELVDLLRVARARQTPALYLRSGQLGQSAVTLQRHALQRNSQAGAAAHRVMCASARNEHFPDMWENRITIDAQQHRLKMGVWHDAGSAYTPHRSIMDLAMSDVPNRLNGPPHEIRFRVWTICVGGAMKSVILPCSEFYDVTP